MHNVAQHRPEIHLGAIKKPCGLRPSWSRMTASFAASEISPGLAKLHGIGWPRPRSKFRKDFILFSWGLRDQC